MNTWITKAGGFVELCLGRPEGIVERLVIAVVAIFVLITVARLAGSAAGVPDAGEFRRVISLAGALLVMLAATIAASIYLLPEIKEVNWHMPVLIAVPAVAALIVGIPVQMLFQRSKYIETLIGFISGLIAAALIIILANTMFDAVRSAGQQSTGIRHRTETMNRVLNEK